MGLIVEKTLRHFYEDLITHKYSLRNQLGVVYIVILCCVMFELKSCKNNFFLFNINITFSDNIEEIFQF